MHNLDKAREWANGIEHLVKVIHPDAQAAIEIIQSLPDNWVDVEKVREIIEGKEGRPPATALPELVRDLRNLIEPKLPTLADMTEEEQKACQWMQARLEGSAFDFVISDPGLVESMLWAKGGTAHIADNSLITPLPVPKLEWPGGVVDAEIVEESATTDSGSIHTPMQPSEVPANEPWLIEVDGEKAIGTRYQGDTDVPWSVATLDGAFAGDYNDREVTLIHKLVPEPHALPEGMRLADHEEYGRVVVSPEDDLDGDYRVFYSQDNTEYGASWGYVNKSELTFLGGANNG